MSQAGSKPFLSLQISDLQQYSVWEDILDNEPDVTVFPVPELPVSSLSGRVVGTTVKLSCGKLVWAIVQYVSNKDPKKNEHFVALRIERNGEWFDLSRYWDVDYSRNGPDALAQFLGMQVDEVFPIAYDISAYASGVPSALSGYVLREPRERLSEDEIIRMAVP